MAKQSEDREDLFRDGIAMPIRGRVWIDGSEVIVGFRTAGQCSIYWDQDPVFQFDAAGRLRRAYVDGQRYKSKGGRLIRLERQTGNSAAVERLRFHEAEVEHADQHMILMRLGDCVQQIRLSVTQQPMPWELIGADGSAFRARLSSLPSTIDEHVIASSI